MTKRAVGWIGVLGLFLAGLCAVILERGVLARVVKREFHRPILVTARAAPDTSQVAAPRTPDFLQPQRLDAWQIIGPGGGGTFYYPAISPHDPNLVFVTTDMSACYVSENGGRTWRTFNLRRTCTFVFDPKLPNRVWAISSGLWRSDNRGHTWSLVYPDGAATVQYLDDEADPYMFSPLGYTRNVAAMAIDPDDSNTLYASVSDQLEVSHDAGKTWKLLAADLDAQQIWVDPTSPRDRRTVYARRFNVIGTWDGAKYTKRTVEGMGEVSWAAFGIPSSGGKPVIYIAGPYVVKEGRQSGGLMASNDGGQTWRSLTGNILKQSANKDRFPNFTTIATSRKHAEVLYVSVSIFVPLTDPKQAYQGVLKSSDGGGTWAPVRLESGVTAANMHDDWTSSRFGPDYGEEPLSMAVDDNNPDLVYTTDLGRVMRTVDGGKNWFGVFSQSTGKGFTTTGLDVTTCYGIHIDPFDPKRMYISYTDIGLMRSEDGGESWLGVNMTGLPNDWRHNAYWVEFDPAVKGKVWAVMASRHDLPRQRMLNMWGGPGGVAESVDGGHTWTASSHGLPSTMSPTHILLDPKSPVGARVLYLTAFGIGVFKSTDGGRNWVRKSDGLPEKVPLTWRMAIASDGTLYVVTIRRSQDGKYGNELDGWLFRSRNGAESWERVPLPEGVNGPESITVDPRDPARLYLSAWARYIQYGYGPLPPGGGVFMSTDGGRQWQNVLNASRRIYDVTVDPRNSDLVYAAGFEASAWRSADRGKTWNRIGGFNFRLGQRVIPDPTDINKIYITTFGNSVWHGPAAGDPKAPEDIISPPSIMFQSAGK